MLDLSVMMVSFRCDGVTCLKLGFYLSIERDLLDFLEGFQFSFFCSRLTVRVSPEATLPETVSHPERTEVDDKFADTIAALADDAALTEAAALEADTLA